MRDLEKELSKKVEREIDISSGRCTLGEAISDWHNLVKKSTLKNRSWDREHHTIENQIKQYDISKIQVQAVDFKHS